jgi:hypothetical protein
MKKTVILSFLFLLFYAGNVLGQKSDTTKLFFMDIFQLWMDHQQDSNYIENYSNEIAGRIIGIRKHNFFTIRDRILGTQINYEPNTKLGIGLGITAKWFLVDVIFKSGLAEENVEGTSAFDFQGRLFSPKQYLDLTYKYYFGYYLNNTANLSIPISDSVRVRDDIRSSYIGLEYMYAYNYNRFSLKAPFVYNEIQKKSAGSFVIGASFVSFMVDGDDSLVPADAQNDFNPNLSFSSLNTVNIGVNAGYMYSLVFLKKCYITLSAIPGIILLSGDYKVDTRKFLGLSPSLSLKTMNSIGYNTRRFYTGLQFSGDAFGARWAEKSGVMIGHSKWKIFVGYRFKSRKT